MSQVATYETVEIVGTGINLLLKANDQNIGQPVKVEVQYGGGIYYRMTDGAVYGKNEVYPDTPFGHAEFARELREKSDQMLAQLPPEFQEAPKASKKAGRKK